MRPAPDGPSSMPMTSSGTMAGIRHRSPSTWANSPATAAAARVRSAGSACTRAPSSSARHRDHVTVRHDGAGVERLEQSLNGAGDGRQPAAVRQRGARRRVVAAKAADRANEGARRIERQRLDVLIVARPGAVALKEVLLDIRRIDGGDDGVMVFQVLADGADGLGTAKVANDGNEQIL